MGNQAVITIDSRSGFTLVELVISLTLLAIIMSALIGALISISNALNKQQEISFLYRESEFMNAQIARSISESFGWIYGDSVCLVLVSPEGDSIRYRWSDKDSSLSINGAKAFFNSGISIPYFHFKYIPKTTAERDIPENLWLGEVDLDRDGKIIGNELLLTDYIKIDYILNKGKTQHKAYHRIKLPKAIIEINFE